MSVERRESPCLRPRIPGVDGLEDRPALQASTRVFVNASSAEGWTWVLKSKLER